MGPTTTRVTLAYGQTGLPIDVPSTRAVVLEPVQLPGLPDEAAAFRDAVRSPIGVASAARRSSERASASRWRFPTSRGRCRPTGCWGGCSRNSRTCPTRSGPS